MNAWNAVWDFLIRRQILKRLILIWAVVMSTLVINQGMSFAYLALAKGPDFLVGAATLIAAVLTPILGLTGYIIKNPYGEKFNEHDKE